MRDGLEAGTVDITGAGADDIPAYAAHPVGDSPSGGVVVIHHMPGYDEGTKEIVRKFAFWGWSAVCPNLHHRVAPGAYPDDAAAASRAAGGVSDEQLTGDVSGAADYLRQHPTGNGRIATIGFCSGGRQSVLAGCALSLDGVIDCYGAFVLDAPPGESGMSVSSLEDRLPDLSAPVLGLFGAEDKHPSPDEVVRFDQLLTALGKPHEFQVFQDAGHGFFAADRPAYRQKAAAQGWNRIRDFLGKRLAG
jgi:carboxymethylenebutenolidase